MSTHEDTEVGAQPPEAAATDVPVAPPVAPAPVPGPSRRSRRASRAERRRASAENVDKPALPADHEPVEPVKHRDPTVPSWWHRSHPVFTSVAGFFTGLLTLVVIPTVFGAVVDQFFNYDTAQRLAPYVLVIFGIPLVLIAVPRTRRFGLFMLVGMLATAVVAAAAAALTLWYLFSHTG